MAIPVESILQQISIITKAPAEYKRGRIPWSDWSWTITAGHK